MKAVERGAVIIVTRQGSPVAIVMGFDRMTAIAETLEILTNPSAMAALKHHKEGKTKFGAIADIPDR